MNVHIIFILIALILLCLYSIKTEAFWGGYMPLSYAGQYVPQFGRTAVIASTDAPKMLCQPNRYPINP